MERTTLRTPAALLALVLLSLAPAALAGEDETLILYDPTPPPETPESIVFDRHDNAYITLSRTARGSC